MNKSQEERFDEKFPGVLETQFIAESMHLKKFPVPSITRFVEDEIKAFISTLLQEQREEIVKEIEDVRSQYEHEVHGLSGVEGFNSALDHVIQTNILTTNN